MRKVLGPILALATARDMQRLHQADASRGDVGGEGEAPRCPTGYAVSWAVRPFSPSGWRCYSTILFVAGFSLKLFKVGICLQNRIGRVALTLFGGHHNYGALHGCDLGLEAFSELTQAHLFIRKGLMVLEMW